ncbi:hypothetical protein QN277_024661 [Acacia crassicarpa]|uniref:Uncharacterized protein n=1 Tax=Acacia crassicarpa TaxID=499986 RepID=A0AAE1JGG9_9FABA|nr:hypothetical protein QN277_024661 [Acacia crassicarpa]
MLGVFPLLPPWFYFSVKRVQLEMDLLLAN